ncbi:putative 2-deoxyglucose-6-phosphate phosphatase [Xylaria bambusicola]|uniref:putative 2-deoxyglucose-6-phosphate phosphatase n=1 Tax=Xylaria bambusicola TaxID=326684 RepID=UPI002007DED2|nr:putative 2-deoxyglucose-6-phosphate phosphatase [Xylaria bambusicola]KAI0502873.1 putative 2-deoxyglucose-6-phosphate phosphatase [Xylaria bambusicola]
MSASQAIIDPNWRPKAIVFDLLTGLANSWDLWGACTPSGTAAEGRRWRERYLQITFGTGAYMPNEDLVKQAAHEAGLPPSAPEALLHQWEHLSAWPETGAVLRTLRRRGYKLAVVTNCSKRLGHLAAHGVEMSASNGSGERFEFDAVITAEESGFYKPVKEAYEAILLAIGLEPEDVLFVAGSAGDVQGAANAGMKVVWHNRIGLPKKGDVVPLQEAQSLDVALKDYL